MRSSAWITWRYCHYCFKPLLEPIAAFSRRTRGTVALCGTRCRAKAGCLAIKRSGLAWCPGCEGWHPDHYECANAGAAAPPEGGAQ